MTTLIDVPPNELPKVQEIYVFMSEDENGDEGIMSHNFLPLIFAKPALLSKAKEQLRVHGLCNVPGRKVKIVRFTKREFVEYL